jgi:SAM-dependent methyltransferase
MKDIILSVVDSLDGNSPELFPYLPYILQDFTEIGADPEVMVNLTKKHIPVKFLQIADLGCGKGAISVAMAKEFDCKITGIDAMPDFIDSAKEFALREHVSEKCRFFTGDIRTEILSLCDFGLVILGAIGDVLGNVGETLIKLRQILRPDGFILLDDAWSKQIEISNDSTFPSAVEYFSMIADAGFKVVETDVAEMSDLSGQEDIMMESMQRRCDELSLKHPQLKHIFKQYIQNQQHEFNMMKYELTCATLLLKRI